MNKMLCMLICGAMFSCNQTPRELPIEIADAKYIDISRDVLSTLSQGNLDGFINHFSANSIYRWNYGDSLVGRKAIYDYWKQRRNSVIDTITFSKETWLSIKANEPPSHVRPGIYALIWADFVVTYANGSSLNMNIHTVFGFDSNDSIVYTLQYLDRSLITNAQNALLKTP
jgi:hypothetical protein